MILGGLHHFAAIAIAQAPVGDYRVVAAFLQFLDGVVGGSRRGGLVAGGLQDGAFQGHHMGLIVHAQDLRHSGVLW